MNTEERENQRFSPGPEASGVRFPEEEGRYRIVFERAPFGILLIDSTGALLEFNEAAHSQLGYSREEFAKLRLADVDPYETPEQIRESMARVLKDGEAEFQVKHVTKHGEIRDVHVITTAMRLGGTTVFQTIWQDITERKQAEERIRKNQERLEDVVRERTLYLSEAYDFLKRDVEERKRMVEEKEKLITELQNALSEIKMLKGMLRVCAWCRKIRDDDGNWLRIEKYIETHSDLKFTHGICPECMEKIEKKAAEGEPEGEIALPPADSLPP